MNYVNPKKSLGQHFLNDKNIAKKITDGLKNEGSLPVIELGPGTGVLTEFLLPRFPNLSLIEIDREAVEFLHNRFSDLDLNIVNANFLKADIPACTELPACLIGNFPYNISSQIFFRLIEYRDEIPETVCMIQDEVAKRIVANHGNKTYGILSILLQTWFDIEYLFGVSPGVFFPPPKVKSAVIRLVRNERQDIGCEWNFYKQVVKTAFNQRRKTLRNALKPLNISLENIDAEVLSKRAEQLSIEDFLEMALLLNKQEI